MSLNVQSPSPSHHLLSHVPRWRAGAYTGVLLLVAACGGSSRAGDPTGTGGDGGSAGSQSGTGGSSGGVAGSGGDGGTAASGAVGGGGSGNGGSATGGAATGGSGGDGGTSAGMGGVSGIGATGGVGNTGGTTGGNGGNAGTGGSPGASGAVGTLGEPCDTPAELACAGSRQRVVLICGADDTWETLETCDGDELCDSTPGASAGSCRAPVPECADEEPGFRYCDGASVRRCGPDLLTADEVDVCAMTCGDGVCDTDDGCPVGDEGYVCSDDCGGAAEDCTEDCSLFLLSPDPGPVLARISGDGGCTACNGQPWFRIGVDGIVAPWPRMRITVSAPWAIIDNATACQRQQCKIVEEGMGEILYDIFLTVSEPDAGPTNVLIEAVDEDAECP